MAAAARYHRGVRWLATVGALAAAVFAGGAQEAQDVPPPTQPDRFPIRIESRYYVIYSTSTEERASALGRTMDEVCQTYADLLTDNREDRLRMLRTVRERRFRLFLYANYAQYRRHAPPGSGAYYDPQRGNLVGFYHPELMHAFFAHEGMHQFTDVAAQGILRFPMWYIEGIADCIGNSEMRNGVLYIAVQDGVIARMRVPVLRMALERNLTWRLETLLHMDRGTFMRQATLGYAHAWSFCHFLLTYPRYGSSRRIAAGIYRWNLSIFHSAIASGRSLTEAMAVAFTRTEHGRPLTLDQLEREWLDWIRRYPELPDPPRLQE